MKGREAGAGPREAVGGRLGVGGVHAVQHHARALELLQVGVAARGAVGRQARQVGDQVEVAVGVPPAGPKAGSRVDCG